jgi:hypothetical protein
MAKICFSPSDSRSFGTAWLARSQRVMADMAGSIAIRSTLTRVYAVQVASKSARPYDVPKKGSRRDNEKGDRVKEYQGQGGREQCAAPQSILAGEQIKEATLRPDSSGHFDKPRGRKRHS